MTKKISGSPENWEKGVLGQEEEFAEEVKIDDAELDEALELKLISIRLQKNLIDDLKLIARHHGVGYQPLIKQALRRFATSELKIIVAEMNDREEIRRESDENNVSQDRPEVA
ncbi:MAG: hypothetical protein CSB48_02810 [Proteobacteria bacterium]|nr:MAG: hypothetical protein CSB48_02810 [Pseudomonadota bacterium]